MARHKNSITLWQMRYAHFNLHITSLRKKKVVIKEMEIQRSQPIIKNAKCFDDESVYFNFLFELRLKFILTRQVQTAMNEAIARRKLQRNNNKKKPSGENDVQFKNANIPNMVMDLYTIVITVNYDR